MPEFPCDSRTRAADLFASYAEVVLKRLERGNPTVDRDDLSDAFVNALLELAAEPDRFDVRRGARIADYLVGAARQALLPLLRTHRRRRAREEKKGAAVAGEASAARNAVDELAAAEWVRLARAVAADERERRVLDLWALNYSDAEIMEQLDLPSDEVRHTRDRLTKRLRRLGPEAQDDET